MKHQANKDGLGGVRGAVKKGRGGSHGGGNIIQSCGLGSLISGLETWVLLAVMERRWRSQTRVL